jgi:deazaflavin-dependent oxidoreductase (nitroreductase family)
LNVSTTFNDFNRNLIKDLRENGGRATSGPFMGRDVLILTTRGKRSGETRENPLAFSRKGEDLVVIASKGGAPSHPSWYHNLRDNPRVTVEVLGEKFDAEAHPVADDDEYETLYAAHAAKMPVFNEYRTKTSRRIPVVVLKRVS